MEIVSGTQKKGFLILNSKVKNQVLVPKYYDPEINAILKALSKTHDLPSIGELVEDGTLQVRQGKEIGKMEYGTGSIPFIRTSDMANWELKSDPKQGVSEETYLKLQTKQDVQAEDILYVRDGTYLVGTACILTGDDAKILYQSHISKIRVLRRDGIDPYLLLAILSGPMVLRQVYSKRLTADIIDSLGERLFEIALPIPKDAQKRAEISTKTEAIVRKRSAFRRRIVEIPKEMQGLPKDALISDSPRVPPYLLPIDKIQANILIPKYYNPAIAKELVALEARGWGLKTVGELVAEGTISLETGVEVGKMAYGTGDIPFVRTSDIANWGLLVLPKQGVSEEIYQEWRPRNEVRANDIFLVRDGTYLVGSSCLITERETKLLYCGGIYRIRVEKPEVLSPFLLLGLLNMPIVRWQMRAKQFTRDVIDTIGRRFSEVVLPLPRRQMEALRFSREVEGILKEKQALLEAQRRISREVAPATDA
ncbi:MAG: hypothetical protein M1311_03285 [Thaumarchaeota archaeon]|jgi:hypothetical protein|nr:hypothetical protein [Nitrososphaerota archaeon]